MKDLSVYVLVSFIACVTPGSGVLYTVTNGLRGGLRTVLASPLGSLHLRSAPRSASA